MKYFYQFCASAPSGFRKFCITDCLQFLVTPEPWRWTYLSVTELWPPSLHPFTLLSIVWGAKGDFTARKINLIIVNGHGDEGMTSIAFFTFKGKSLCRTPDPTASVGVARNTKLAPTRISNDLHNVPQSKCIMDHSEDSSRDCIEQSRYCIIAER